MFHIVSACIAVPVVIYAIRPFLASSLRALRAGHTNMDVPITLAVLLAVGSSLYETVQGGHQVFFDAAVTLLFFLLIGRYLDRLMRARARSAVTGLARLSARGAMRLRADGGLEYLALDEIAPGMILRIAAGERLPVDICIERGTSDLDRSLVTGEALPIAAGPGAVLEAGTLNLTGALDVRVLRPASGSYLAEMMAMLAAAEQGRGRYVRIADRASRLYAPVVHLLALLTFAGWMIATGDGHRAIFVAISVLIITCPCALGLAVPVAHVVSAGRLFRGGILLKDGSALERLAEIDGVVFDKTGTLTTDLPLVTGCDVEAADRAAALALALHSTHPVSKALARFLGGVPADLTDVVEVPGRGIEARVAGRLARLGQGAWVGEIARGAIAGHAFAVEGGKVAGFTLSETLRPGARLAVLGLQKVGLAVEILSGDAARPVAAVAAELGIADARSGQSPADKIARLETLRAAGHRVLMVGDGLNDTAALATAHVSMAPASASDAGRMAADFVFTRGGMAAVSDAHALAKRTAQIVRQNFILAIGYNAIAIPLAVAGYVTPLVAALAMSGSSIIVVGNSLRLNRMAHAPAAVLREVLA